MYNSWLQRRLRLVAHKLSLDVEIPFTLQLPCGIIEAEALIKGFEFENGILCISSMDQLGGMDDILGEFGYGYICISNSSQCELWTYYDWISLFKNCEWTSEQTPPIWYTK